MGDRRRRSPAARPGWALPPLDGRFAGMGYHLTGQAKNPLSRVNLCDAMDRGPEWTNDPHNLLSRQHWSVSKSTKREKYNKPIPSSTGRDTSEMRASERGFQIQKSTCTT